MSQLQSKPQSLQELRISVNAIFDSIDHSVLPPELFGALQQHTVKWLDQPYSATDFRDAHYSERILVADELGPRVDISDVLSKQHWDAANGCFIPHCIDGAHLLNLYDRKRVFWALRDRHSNPFDTKSQLALDVANLCEIEFRESHYKYSDRVSSRGFIATEYQQHIEISFADQYSLEKHVSPVPRLTALSDVQHVLSETNPVFKFEQWKYAHEMLVKIYALVFDFAETYSAQHSLFPVGLVSGFTVVRSDDVLELVPHLKEIGLTEFERDKFRAYYTTLNFEKLVRESYNNYLAAILSDGLSRLVYVSGESERKLHEMQELIDKADKFVKKSDIETLLSDSDSQGFDIVKSVATSIGVNILMNR